MGRLLALFVAALGVPEAPDGQLVMGVVDRSGGGHRERVVVADPRTGASRARRLRGGTLCYTEMLAVGDRVVFGGHRGARGVALSLPFSLRGPARSLGAADTLTPSATPGRLWLGRWRASGTGSGVQVSEVDLEGRRITSRARLRLPGWARLEAALENAFVVGHGRRLAVWGRRLDRPLRSIPDGWPVAAGGSRLAWCGPRCEALHVWTGTGEQTFRPPPGVRILIGDGAFSPDGDRLAVPVTYRHHSRVAVLDRDGGWTLVPGRLRGFAALAWSPLGGWLYSTGGGERVLAWAPGMERPARVPVDPGGTVMSISAAG